MFLEHSLSYFPTMAFVRSNRIPISRIFSSYTHSLSSSLQNPFFISAFPRFPSFKISRMARFTSSSLPSSTAETNTQICNTISNGGCWRPMCLYHTQGKCTLMDDPLHLEKFNHDFWSDLQVNAAYSSQDIDFFLVLDLEGKVEILEFPVLLLDAKSLGLVDLFHRFVRPSKLSEGAVNKYIDGKYGKMGVDRVWHDTAQPFKEVIQQFEVWLNQHHLWDKNANGSLSRAAFVTCGNWDLKSMVPKQCEVSETELPPYFLEWINLKDVYLNFYGREARGMMAMMKQLDIQLLGSHHLGIDDSKNIARVLQRMIADGANMQITARMKPESQRVEYHFENRIRHQQKRGNHRR